MFPAVLLTNLANNTKQLTLPFELFGAVSPSLAVSKESVRSAAIEAIERLRMGEHSLAVTQHCGTNILVSAALTVIVSAVIVRGSKSWIRRIQGMTTGLVVARIATRPIGVWLQRHATTLPYSDDTEIKSVRGFQAGPVTVCHVRTGPTNI